MSKKYIVEDEINNELARHIKDMRLLTLKKEVAYRNGHEEVKACLTCKHKRSNHQDFEVDDCTCNKYLTDVCESMICDDYQSAWPIIFQDEQEPPNYRDTDEECCLNCKHSICENNDPYECKFIEAELDLHLIYVCNKYERLVEKKS